MKLSVVICSYNYGHLLQDTLRTVAAQTFKDFELLIVDDGSTDNTEEVVGKSRPQFQALRYLKKTHTGLADSRNTGVKAAQGTHIAFLDADDLWSPRYLSTIRETLSVNPRAGLILCEGIVFRSENGAVTEATFHRELPALCGPVRSTRELFDVVQSFTPSGMVFSRELYNRTGPFDVPFFGFFGNDLDWMFRALMKQAECVSVKQKLYLYRRHDDNMTNKAADSFNAWLMVYSHTLKESRADAEFEALARGVIRSHSVRFLPTCPTSQGRQLLRRGIETLGGDPVVRLWYIGTFLGFVSLLKLLKQVKRISRGLFRKKLAIDLYAFPEVVIEALEGHAPRLPAEHKTPNP